MRIDPNLTVTPVAIDKSKQKESAPATGRTRTRGDVVQLSSAAAAAGAQPTDITARLSAIKSQIASGTYPIDLDKLAARISEEDLR